MAPRADGTPTIMEITVKSMMDEEDIEGDPVEVIARVKAKIGRDPEDEDIMREFGIDPRRDKPWPPEEDCQGCDKHKDGPHRFGCSIHGKRQVTFTVNKIGK